MEYGRASYAADFYLLQSGIAAGFPPMSTAYASAGTDVASYRPAPTSTMNRL
jgi:hypothetical protein